MITPIKFNFLNLNQNRNMNSQNASRPVLMNLAADTCSFTGKQSELDDELVFQQKNPKVSSLTLLNLSKITKEIENAPKGRWYSNIDETVTVKEINDFGSVSLTKILQDGTEISVKKYKEAPCVLVKIKNEASKKLVFGEIYTDAYSGNVFIEKGEVRNFSEGFDKQFFEYNIQKFSNSKMNEHIPVTPQKIEFLKNRLKTFWVIKNEDKKKAIEILQITPHTHRALVKRFKNQKNLDFSKILIEKERESRLPYEVQQAIIKIGKEDSDIGVYQIIDVLKEQGIMVSHKGITNVLNKNGLERMKSGHALKYRKPQAYFLKPEEEALVVELFKSNPYLNRKKMVEALAEKNLTISSEGVKSVLVKNGLENIEERLEFLKANNITIKNIKKLKETTCQAHNRTDAEMERKALDIALQNPWWGYKKLSDELKGLNVTIGYRAVESLLKRKDLETSLKRIALAEKKGIEIKGDEEALEFMKLVEEIGAGKACEKFGYNQKKYSRIKTMYEFYGKKYIPNGPNITSQRKSMLAPEKEKMINTITFEHPEWGAEKVSREAEVRGIIIGTSTIKRLWENKKILNSVDRIKYAKKNKIKTEKSIAG